MQDKDVVEFEPQMQPVPFTGAPLEAPTKDLEHGLQVRTANRNIFLKWIFDALVKGVDYIKIHFVGKDKCRYGRNCPDPNHWSKAFLTKSGAEKIVGMLGLKPHWPALKDYEQMAVTGKDVKNIILRCEIVGTDGTIHAEGMGARSIMNDGGDLNKAIKMAKKSSLLDATLTLGGLSEVFSQDYESVLETDQIADEEGVEVPKITTDQRTILHDIAWEHFEKLGQRDEATLAQKTEATLTGLAHSMGVKSGKIEDLAGIKFEDAKDILTNALKAKAAKKKDD